MPHETTLNACPLRVRRMVLSVSQLVITDLIAYVNVFRHEHGHSSTRPSLRPPILMAASFV